MSGWFGWPFAFFVQNCCSYCTFFLLALPPPVQWNCSNIACEVFFYVLLICVTLFSNSTHLALLLQVIFSFFWWHYSHCLSVKCLLASPRTSEGNFCLELDLFLQLLLLCSFSRGSYQYPVGFSVLAERYGLYWISIFWNHLKSSSNKIRYHNIDMLSFQKMHIFD